MHIKTIVRYHYTYNTGKNLKLHNTDSKDVKQWENTLTAEMNVGKYHGLFLVTTLLTPNVAGRGAGFHSNIQFFNSPDTN